MRLAEGLYKKYALKRVFFSAYIPVGTHALLPKNQPPPLLREHRLYQVDWLLRFYGFRVDELLDEQHPSLDPLLDPKCNWALNHLEQFPVEINRAGQELLLRVPGIGVKSAMRIMTARRAGTLSFEDLKKIGVVLKRAVYFITCKGQIMPGMKFTHSFIYQNLTADIRMRPGDLPMGQPVQQLSWMDIPAMLPGREDTLKCLTGQL
jgi:predicted DNA-binding helix-hairpin-helix protein